MEYYIFVRIMINTLEIHLALDLYCMRTSNLVRVELMIFYKFLFLTAHKTKKNHFCCFFHDAFVCLCLTCSDFVCCFFFFSSLPLHAVPILTLWCYFQSVLLPYGFLCPPLFPIPFVNPHWTPPACSQGTHQHRTARAIHTGRWSVSEHGGVPTAYAPL